MSVRIDGLACPFCAHNIDKRVRKLDGVDRQARVMTSVETGVATFPWKPGVAFDPQAVRKAIRDAGFTPREISIVVTGSIEAPGSDSEDPLRLVDDRDEPNLDVSRASRADRRESWERLGAYAGEATNNPRVRLEGEVRTDDAGNGRWWLVLHRWAPLAPGAEFVLEVEDLACERCSVRTMRALGELDGVIHVEADHETDRVHVWAKSREAGTAPLRERIESLGFRVTHAHELSAGGG